MLFGYIFVLVGLLQIFGMLTSLRRFDGTSFLMLLGALLPLAFGAAVVATCKTSLHKGARETRITVSPEGVVEETFGPKGTLEATQEFKTSHTSRLLGRKREVRLSNTGSGSSTHTFDFYDVLLVDSSGAEFRIDTSGSVEESLSRLSQAREVLGVPVRLEDFPESQTESGSWSSR